jgi:hypothetical protein
VILAPTNGFKGADVQKLLGQHGIPFYALEECIVGQDDGTLFSPNSLSDIVSGTASTKPSAVTVSQASRPRGKGFEPNASDHRRVASVAAGFGEGWMKRLPDVCRELHRVGADVPTNWREEAMVETWEEIAVAVEGPGRSADREKVSKYIKYREKWVRQNPPESP